VEGLAWLATEIPTHRVFEIVEKDMA
jgi:peptide/nickel transport system permease protein